MNKEVERRQYIADQKFKDVVDDRVFRDRYAKGTQRKDIGENVGSEGLVISGRRNEGGTSYSQIEDVEVFEKKPCWGGGFPVFKEYFLTGG